MLRKIALVPCVCALTISLSSDASLTAQTGHRRDCRERADTAGDDEEVDAMSAKIGEPLLPLLLGSAELERV